MLKTNMNKLTKKGNPFTMVLKNHGNLKNQNNFILTLKLSTV